MMWFVPEALAGLAIQASTCMMPTNVSPRDLDLEAFVQQQRQVALRGALNNIGPNDSMVPGLGPGIVVASPSKLQPNYFYTWTRDSSLVMKMIVDEFVLGRTELEPYINNFVHSQAVLQTVSNPAGTLIPNGKGVGQARFNVDGTRWHDLRPQADGPALRAITLITYGNWLISNGQEEKARNIVWPVISNDLSYTGQYWNSTSVEIWEGLNGSSFFTTQVQYRALVEGLRLAARLNIDCNSCQEAPQVLCFLQSYWNGAFFVGNINVDTGGRNGIDANTLLGPIHVFDIRARCDDLSLQPCNSRSLANFKSLIDIFRDSAQYPINTDIPPNEGVAVGRFKEDDYNGNPWYLTTAAAAEYLFDAVGQWKTQESLIIDEISLAFFKDIYPSAATGTYSSNSSEFNDITTRITAYADSFVSVIQKYTPANGTLSEQFSKVPPGEPMSAHDLTWSYASFVTMAQRRAGQFGSDTWVPSSPPSQLPEDCKPSSTIGSYAPALAAGAPEVSETCLSDVLFRVRAATNPPPSDNNRAEEKIYISGDTVDLGRTWDRPSWWVLFASNYTAEQPLWSVRIPMSAEKTVSYLYARVRGEEGAEDIIFESANRTLTVPSCAGRGDDEILLETDDVWNGPTFDRPADLA